MVDSCPLVGAENVHGSTNGGVNYRSSTDHQLEVLKMNSAGTLDVEEKSSPVIFEEVTDHQQQPDNDDQDEEVILLSEEEEEDEDDGEVQGNGGHEGENGTSVIVANCQAKVPQQVERDDDLEIIEISSTPPPAELESKQVEPEVTAVKNEASNKIVNNNDSTTIVKHKFVDGKTANNNVVAVVQQNCVGRQKQQESPKEDNHVPSKPGVMGLSEENRKVEPLKINLNREPIRTIIKLPPSSAADPPSSPKITIKPLKPPPAEVVPAPPPTNSIPKLTIKPIVNPDDPTAAPTNLVEQMHIIPKVHIKNPSGDSSGGTDEPHIVHKITIRGVNNAGSSASLNDSSNSTNLANSGSPPLIPKLTIKKDNHNHHSSHQHHPHYHAHLNNRLVVAKEDDSSSSSSSSNPPAIPKLHIKAKPEPTVVPNSSASVPSCPVLTSSEGVKLTIKPIPEPPLPKLTIKTSSLDSNDASLVSSTSSSFSPKLITPPLVSSPNDQHSSISSTIPKLTIKPIPKPPPAIPRNPSEVPIPKLTIKPMPPKPTTATSEDSCSSETSINSLESSPISSSSSSVINSPSAIPKLTIKVPKEGSDSVVTSLPQLTACTTTPTVAIPVVTKINIKPIPPQEQNSAPKEPVAEAQPETVPKMIIKTLPPKSLPNAAEQQQQLPKITVKPIPKQDLPPTQPTEPSPSSNSSVHQPLEVATTTNSKTLDSGCDSPRIILKINKGSSCTSTIPAVTPEKNEIVKVNELKRTKPAENSVEHKIDKVGDVPELKKIKLALNHVPPKAVAAAPSVESDVIVIDDDSKSETTEDPLEGTNDNVPAQPEPKPTVEVPKQPEPEETPEVVENKQKEKRPRWPRPPTPGLDPDRPRRAAALQAIPASILLRRNHSSSSSSTHTSTPTPTPAAPTPSPPVPEPVSVPAAASAPPAATSITSVLLIENDEGSSSDCMIIDDPLTLAEKNGTSSNSNSSSFSVPSSATTLVTPATPATVSSVSQIVLPPKVRMSTRSSGGKDAVTQKAADKDSGLDEGKPDLEDAPTPAKRARGRPKKIVPLRKNSEDGSPEDGVVEANGSVSSDGGAKEVRVSPRVLLKALTPSRLDDKLNSSRAKPTPVESADEDEDGDDGDDDDDSSVSSAKDPLSGAEAKSRDSIVEVVTPRWVSEQVFG